MRKWNCVVVMLVAIIVSCHSATEKTQSKTKKLPKGANMKITSISFSGSNPSMGPHNSPSENTLSMAPYQNELKHLLEDTQVNGLVTLQEYLNLHKQNKQAELTKIHDAYNPKLTQGARIIDLNFFLEDGTTITLNDLRTFQLTGDGFTDFEKLIREKGSVHKTPSENELKNDPTLEPFPAAPAISKPAKSD